MGNVTEELRAFTQGEQEALDRVMELVYAQLRGVAHKTLCRARASREDAGLETGDLFHESYLRLRSLTPQSLSFDHRGGFFRYCISIMQCHLREHSEKKRALKRGGGVKDASLDELVSPNSLKTLAEIIPDKQTLSFADILAFEDLLEHYRTQFRRQADVLAHKVYLEMNNEDIAQVLGISVSTVNRDLCEARAWLAQHLNPAAPAGDNSQPPAATRSSVQSSRRRPEDEHGGRM